MPSRFGDDNWHYDFDRMLLNLEDQQWRLRYHLCHVSPTSTSPLRMRLVQLQNYRRIWTMAKEEWASLIQASSLGRLARREAGLPEEIPVPKIEGFSCPLQDYPKGTVLVRDFDVLPSPR